MASLSTGVLGGSGVVQGEVPGVTDPSLSRMGHVDELPLRADLGALPATTLKLARFGNHAYGRSTPMAGF
jgi:hypothetical protein